MELEIRPATPSDAQKVRAFLEGLSEDSRWLRYHSPVPIVRGWMVDAVVNSDHETREALLAIDGGRVLGVAEWGIDNSQAGTAHVAVVVDEAFRRRGVARELTEYLVANAREHGIGEFVARVLSLNRPTMGLIQRVAPQRQTRFDGPTVEVRIPLSVPA